MSHFVTFPQHWNRGPITVNVDKVYFIDHSNSHPGGARIAFDRDCSVEVKLSVEEVIALFNGTTPEKETS